VTLQFAISIILIAGTILIYQQLKFMQSEKNWGLKKNNMMVNLAAPDSRFINTAEL
jgi:hypothetical protein